MSSKATSNEPRRGKATRTANLLIGIILLAFASAAQAYSYLAAQVRDGLAGELYPVERVLPGYRKPRVEAPRLAVAEFRTGDDALHVWSQAVGEVLTYRVQYVPGVRLYMPAPYNNHVDAGADVGEDRPLLTGPAAFKNLHKALGIDSILTGEVSREGDNLVLRVELVDAESGETKARRGWKFAESRLPDVLIKTTHWVYQQLDVKLTPAEHAHISDRDTLRFEDIRAFIDNYRAIIKLDSPLRTEKVKRLYEDHPNLPLLSIYALHTRPYAQNLDEAYRNLEYYEEIRSRFPGNAGVALESYRVIEIDGLPKHEVSKRLNNMRDLVVANPQDPTAMIVFADALVRNGETFEGISVMLEAVDRWPGNYRAWWSLGWALNRHAWQVRGDSYWRDVPERAKEQFTLLSGYADQAVDEALALNPYAPTLWSMKINSIGSKEGFSKELMATFDRAIEVGPDNRWAYENALNYATGKWGGNATARRHIIDAAERNNPGATWVEAMKRRHVTDLDNWQQRLGTSPVEIFIKEILDHPAGKYIGAFVIVMVLVLVFQLGRKWA